MIIYLNEGRLTAEAQTIADMETLLGLSIIKRGKGKYAVHTCICGKKFKGAGWLSNHKKETGHN